MFVIFYSCLYYFMSVIFDNIMSIEFYIYTLYMYFLVIIQWSRHSGVIMLYLRGYLICLLPLHPPVLASGSASWFRTLGIEVILVLSANKVLQFSCKSLGSMGSIILHNPHNFGGKLKALHRFGQISLHFCSLILCVPCFSRGPATLRHSTVGQHWPTRRTVSTTGIWMNLSELLVWSRRVTLARSSQHCSLR